ncbi:outer membrane beta-barrel protein [Chitinophaga arvensicola]|uniref:Outer membrane protein beta-barrel family protein n=1 Tax=Chitinophaga arvensicola TaxID=29529 RepID=A0A1I0RSS9_9BACT|nr:outer membrane beta-barrel protein [Chitinophaga arvensicola]SEW44293.1 Outer membrane protein beta-barrel family protein [Chitinophaga arvensicola]
MYKFLLTVIFLVAGSSLLVAQTKPLPVRRVNGIVKDSLGKTIPMATVRLVSAKDTINTLSSEYGVFNFTGVKSADFTIQVQVMSYHPYHKRYFFNDTKPILVLPAMIMTSSLVQLKGIVVTTAKGPQERGDTTEFWAKDYIVRDYARLEDLLKRMEGVTVGTDGKLNYHGKPIARALFNGKKYFGGDVVSAIKELPADIVERIQIIDDNADGTGPKLAKSDESSKTLNIVTKADRSAGKMYQVNMEAGTQDRYLGALSARSIDASKQWSISAGGSQQPLGIAQGEQIGTVSNMMRTFAFGGGGGGMSGGTAKNSLVNLQYSNMFGKLQFNANYFFSDNHMRSETESLSEQFFNEGTMRKKTKSTVDNSTTSHRAVIGASLYQKDFSMFLNVDAAIDKDNGNTLQETTQTGMLESFQRNRNYNGSTRPQLGLMSRFNFFRTRKVMLDVMLNSRYNSSTGSGDETTDTYGLHSTTPDSSLTLQQKMDRTTLSNTLETTVNYGKGKKLEVRLNTGLSQQQNDNSNYRDELRAGLDPKRLNDQSNDNTLVNYKVPTKLAVVYNVNKDLSVELNGTYEMNWQQGKFRTKNLDLSTHMDNFLPGFFVKYINRTTGNLSFSYNKRVQLPDLLQLNSTPYYETPFDVVVGNKDLVASVTGNWSLNYNFFIPRVNIDLNAGVNLGQTANTIAADRRIQIDTATKTMRTETHFRNVDGTNFKSVNYGIGKSFPAIRMTLNFTGGLNFGRSIYFANNRQETNDMVSANHSLNMVVTPVKWLDLSPELSYRTQNSKNSLAMNGPIYNKEFLGSLKSSIILPQNITVNIHAVQSMTAATNLLTSPRPLVIDANVEMRMLKRKDAIISFVVMDMLQQNRSTAFNQMENGFINYVSSSKSRYFLCQFSWQPQRFTRSKSAKGVRNSDGSFGL